MPELNCQNRIENDPLYQQARRTDRAGHHIVLSGDSLYPGEYKPRGDTPLWVVLFIIVVVPSVASALWIML